MPKSISQIPKMYITIKVLTIKRRRKDNEKEIQTSGTNLRLR
jgi:hypothetical protein